MCWGNHDQEDHEDVDFVDLEAQTGKQTAPPDLDRVRSGSMSGLKLTTEKVAWAVGGLLLLVVALCVGYYVFASPNKGLHVDRLREEQNDQTLLADQRLAGQSGAEEEADQEEERQERLEDEQKRLEEEERQRWLTELQSKSDKLKQERVAKKQQEQKEERRKHLALTAEYQKEIQKTAEEQEKMEQEALAATATRQSGFDSIIPTVNFSYRPIAANGFSADKEEVKEIRETEDDDEMEMDKWIKEEEKRENDVVKPRSFGVLSQPQLPQNQLDSGNGSSIQHVIQRTQSHAPLQYSNQSQTQLIQPVAPLSFS
eukprot:563698_1